MEEGPLTLEVETARANNAVRALQRIVRVMGPTLPPGCEAGAEQWNEAVLVAQAALVTDSHFYGTGGGVMVEMLAIDPNFADHLTDAFIRRVKHREKRDAARAEARAHVFGQFDGGVEVGATQHGPAPEESSE